MGSKSYKYLLVVFFSCVFSYTTQAQIYYQVTDSNTVQSVGGGYTVTITPIGYHGYVTPSATWCEDLYTGHITPPFTTNFPGGYKYVFSKHVSNIRCQFFSVNPGDTLMIKFNGVQYFVTSANLSPFTISGCASVFYINNGIATSDGCVTSSNTGLNNFQFDAQPGYQIDSVEILEKASYGAGFAWNFYFGNRCPGAVVVTTQRDSLCTGDTLQLYATDTATSGAATYAWSGPNGFHSSQKNPIINNIPSVGGGIYALIITDTGCHYISSKAVVVSTSPAVIALANSPVCQGATLNLSTPTTTATAYGWGGPNGFTSSQRNVTVPNIQVAASGIYSLTASINNCSSTATTNVTVIPFYIQPVADIMYSCVVDSIHFSVIDTNTTNFRWNFGDGLIGIGSDITHLYAEGKYVVTLYGSGATCQDSATLLLNLDHPLQAGFTTSKSVFCEGEQIGFANTSIDTPVNDAKLSYQWSFGDGGTSIVADPTYAYNTRASNYTVMLVVKDNSNCYDTALAAISIIPKPDHYNMDTSFCKTDVLMIGKVVDNADGYQWHTQMQETTATVIVSGSGLYTVTATNTCGYTEDSVNVRIYDCDACVFAPGAFTPNGDGYNDYFHVRPICAVQNYSIKIYNRLGQLVYKGNNINDSWDGNMNGVQVDLGTYFYEIQYTPASVNARPSLLKGDVTLIR